MTQFARPAFGMNRPTAAPSAAPAAMPAPTAPSTPQRSIFGTIAAAKASMNANYMKKGRYLMLINAVKHIATTRKSTQGIVFEMTCIHVFDNNQGQGHFVGEACTNGHFSNNEGWEGRTKAAFVGITGLPEEQIGEEFIAQVIQQNLFSGAVVDVENYDYITKRNPKPIIATRYNGAVSFSNLTTILTDAEKAQFFPGGRLDELIKEENAQIAAQQAAGLAGTR